MPSIYQSLLLLSAASSLTSAAVLKERTPASGAFRFETVPKARSTVRNGFDAYAKVLRKYAHLADDTAAVVSKAAALANSSSVVASSVDGDIEYIVPVRIGTQTFQIDIDSGSSDL